MIEVRIVIIIIITNTATIVVVVVVMIHNVIGIQQFHFIMQRYG